MIWYPFRTPEFVKSLFPSITFQKETPNSIFLTFDDGPDPEATPYVLDLLEEYSAKATFFMVGNRVKSDQNNLVERVVKNGHSIGNHTMNHLDGWRTSVTKYIKDIEECQLVLNTKSIPTNLFRPPYGRIHPGLLPRFKHFETIMWSHLSGDFDLTLKTDKALKGIRNMNSGSIIVFHDSTKALENLKKILPWTLQHYRDRGFTFDALNPSTPSD